MQDRQKGLSYPCQVTLVVDCRSGLPGRLVPILHNLPEQALPVEAPHTAYVSRWESQERVFRDMRACQNLDANYGHKKVVVPNRRVERKQDKLQRKLHTWEKRVATAQRKVQEYTEQITALEQEAQQKEQDNQEKIIAMRRMRQEATLPKQRERFLIQKERLVAKEQIQQIRFRERRRRLLAEQRTWQQKLAKRQNTRNQVAQALHELEDRPFYDLDLEKDNLMTCLQMAGENAHRFVQERYFAGTFLEKVDETTMVRLIYNQPGQVQRRGPYLQVRLLGYRDSELQAAVAHACQRVNQAQVDLPNGHRLRMTVADKILSC